MFDFNPRLEVEEKFATGYEQRDDTTWHVVLREGIQFHDATEFNAESVKASFDPMFDPALKSERAEIFEMIEAVNIIDNHTIEFVTKYPVQAFSHYLTHDAGGIISKSLIDEDYQNAIDKAGLDMTIEEYYDLREIKGESFSEVAEHIKDYTGDVVEQNPVGTGYMKFKSWEDGESIVLEKFYDYWDLHALLETIEFKAIPESEIGF